MTDDGMKFICKKCGSKFPLIPKSHGIIHVTFYPNEPKPTELCDGEIVPIPMEGWSKPNRPIKDRSGHARWAHYFVDGKSLCGRWWWREGDEPLFTRNDLHSFGYCVTCRNKLAKQLSKVYGNGWAKPPNEERYHYFHYGMSMCTGFIQHQDGQAEVEGTRCSYCETQVKHWVKKK